MQPTIDLPAHFNGRERLLRHIPSGHAAPTLGVLKQIVNAIGSHWPDHMGKSPNDKRNSNGSDRFKANMQKVQSDHHLHLPADGRQSQHSTTSSHVYQDLTPRSGAPVSAIPAADGGAGGAGGASSEEVTPVSAKRISEKRNSLSNHPEVVISMDLSTEWNKLYVSSVHNALEYLFSIGFRYDATKGVMGELVFDTKQHVKDLIDMKNYDLPIPDYIDFDCDLYVKEIDEALEWHKKRIAFLTKKLKSSKCVTVTKLYDDDEEEENDKQQHAGEGGELDGVDEDIKCAIDVPDEALLHGRLSILKDDRNADDVRYLVEKCKVHMSRVQKYRDRMQNY